MFSLEQSMRSTAYKIAQVPLSHDTKSQNIQELVYDVKNQFIEQIMLATYFSLQLDTCTYF